MEEVARLWASSTSVSPINQSFVRTLLLTGQRRETVAQMRRLPIENGGWNIPREAMKGGRRHSLPLPRIVLDMIDETPPTGKGDLVFLDWRLHDLRRTADTHIARFGDPRIVV